MLPSWLNLLIEARVQRELMWQLVEWDKLHAPEIDTYRRKSFDSAEEAGYLMPDMPTPLLLKFDEELTESFAHGQSRWHQEKYDAGKAENEARRIAEIEGFIATKNWDALSLPSPETLFADLGKGERSDVRGHILNPDEEGVWVTNPYGCDCALWQDITLETIEAFLVDMARGEEYGPVPN